MVLSLRIYYVEFGPGSSSLFTVSRGLVYTMTLARRGGVWRQGTQTKPLPRARVRAQGLDLRVNQADDDDNGARASPGFGEDGEEAGEEAGVVRARSRKRSARVLGG